jgi:hypothetical protein
MKILCILIVNKLNTHYFKRGDDDCSNGQAQYDFRQARKRPIAPERHLTRERLEPAPRNHRSCRSPKPVISTPNRDRKLRKLVQDHFDYVDKNHDICHQKVTKYFESHTVSQVCATVKSGIPDFLKFQLEKDEVDLDTLAARVSIDMQLQTSTTKRGAYLSSGRPGSSSRVQNFVSPIAMQMHNNFEEQDSIHRDAICSGLSLDASPVLKISCLSVAIE